MGAGPIEPGNGCISAEAGAADAGKSELHIRVSFVHIDPRVP
jgi:hypothetical protein